MQRSFRVQRLLLVGVAKYTDEAGLERFSASQGGAEVGYRGATAVSCRRERR